MKALWLFCSFALAGQASAQEDCIYQNVLNYLNLSRTNELFTSARPVVDWRRPTVVKLDVYLYAILAVIEKSQTFIPFIWVSLSWNNEFISWDPEQFCGISTVTVPQEMLWQPDLVIMECTEDSDKMFQMRNLQFSHRGTVSVEDGFRVISTCNMDIYKFPFDTQRCVFTFASSIYSDSEIQLEPASNSSWLTHGSQQYMQPQGEWDFVNISVVKAKLSFNGQQWDLLKYTITIKRRPMLILMHFLLPVLFFLILDLASFLISDTTGEKLGFKVTVLLAISVLLLMLNDILPSTAGSTPLIATYCIAIFAFLLVSLLEAILVKYLIEKDASVRRPAADGSHCKQEAESGNACSTCRACSVCSCRCVENATIACEPGCGTEGLTDSQLLRLAVQKLQNMRQTCAAPDAGRAGPGAGPEARARPRYWGKTAKRMHMTYFWLYLVTVCGFLLYLILEWSL